jgi:hypothetical protein
MEAVIKMQHAYVIMDMKCIMASALKFAIKNALMANV